MGAWVGNLFPGRSPPFSAAARIASLGDPHHNCSFLDLGLASAPLLHSIMGEDREPMARGVKFQLFLKPRHILIRVHYPIIAFCLHQKKSVMLSCLKKDRHASLLYYSTVTPPSLFKVES